MFKNKNLRLNNSKTKTAMNIKISIFAICVEAIIYLLLHNFHDGTFKRQKLRVLYINEILISWENRECYLFHFCCCVLLFDFLKYASLCNLIKLVNILYKYAANEQKLFSKH